MIENLLSIVLFLFPILLLHFCYLQWSQGRYLSCYPWVGGEDKILFSRLRARIHNVANFKAVIQGAYQKYSLNHQTFILPTSADDLIILPPDHMEWIINQPDHVLSSIHPHVDSLQSDYTFPDPRVIRSPTHHHVVKRELTQQLGNLTGDIVDEIRHATDLFWPKSEDEFQSVYVFATMMKVVARTSNRIFVGIPLCRNEEYLASAAGFAREVPTQAATLKQLPSLSRPLAAQICLSKNRGYIRQFTSLVRPEIEKRQVDMTDPEKCNRQIPNDALQWLINRAEDMGGIERDPGIIAGRLMALNFAAVHTSTFSITNTIFDLVASKPEDRFIEQLREEAETVLAQQGGVWTKAGLARMHKTDSALRESLRLGSFLGPGMTRKVVVKEGILSPNGTLCPYGAKVAIASTGIHNDSQNYPKSATYDPFRFSRQRNADSDVEDMSSDFIKKANLAFVSTSMTYHPFGHGKHCCPGRFFAASELKLMLAQLLLTYDFELMNERPKSMWRGLVYIPPMANAIRVRRRHRYVDDDKL